MRSKNTTVGGFAFGCAALLIGACSQSTASTVADGGGASTDAGDAGDAVVAVAPAHCGIDSVFPPRDAGAPFTCQAARYYLSCNVPAQPGAMALCLSDDPTQCDTSSTMPTSGCGNQCAANEYGAECGGLTVSDAGQVTPPSSCRSIGVIPSGTQLLCCPCE